MKKRKSLDHRPLVFTREDLREAWDKALAGSTVGENRIPVARSFESYSYKALEEALEKRHARKNRR